MPVHPYATTEERCAPQCENHLELVRAFGSCGGKKDGSINAIEERKGGHTEQTCSAALIRILASTAKSRALLRNYYRTGKQTPPVRNIDPIYKYILTFLIFLSH